MCGAVGPRDVHVTSGRLGDDVLRQTPYLTLRNEVRLVKDDIVLDQAYLVPEREVGRLPQDVVAETAGRYMYVPWPDSAAHMDDDGILNGISTADAEDDLDGVFVPVDEEA